MAEENDWAERFRTHDTHNSLASCKTVVTSAAESFSKHPAANSLYPTLDAAITYLEQSLTQAIPELCPLTPLNQANNVLLEINRLTQEYVSSGETNHLDQIDKQITALITHASAIPCGGTPMDSQIYSDYTQSFKRITNDLITGIRSEITELTDAVVKNTQGAETFDAKLKALITDLENTQETVDSYTDTVDRQFKELVLEKGTTFDTVVKEKSTELEGAASILLNEMEDHRDQSEELLGIVGEKAVTTGFAQSAGAESQAANRYRWGSLAAMATAGALLVWLTYDISNQGYDLDSTLIRILFAAAFFVPATYLARESANHRNKANHYRKMALELKAFAPFIQELDEEDRKKKIILMADRYFGQEFEKNPGSEVSLDLLSQMATIIKKAGS